MWLIKFKKKTFWNKTVRIKNMLIKKKISMRLISKEDLGLAGRVALQGIHLIPLQGLLQGFSSVSSALM